VRRASWRLPPRLTPSAARTGHPERFIGLALLIVVPGMLRQVVQVAVSWSTVKLFGKVPRTREPHLFVMSVGSICWIVAAVSVVVPPVAAFLLGFLPLPERIYDLIAWYVMLAFTIVIPPLVSFAIVRALPPDDRPHDPVAIGGMFLKGYPFVLCLALILVVMSVVRLVTLLRNHGRRWTERHVPVITQPQDYASVLDDIRKVLGQGDMAVQLAEAGWPLSVPTRILTMAGTFAVRGLLTERPMALRSDRLEAVLHLSDLVLWGRERDVNRARALLAEQLAFSRAYLTWSEEANALEDRLRSIWQDFKDAPDTRVDPSVVDRLEAVEKELRTTDLAFGEWEVLMREKLLVERSLLHVAMGLIREPMDLTEVAPEEMGAARLHDVVDAPPDAGQEIRPRVNERTLSRGPQAKGARPRT
jgi:hypothetical protein